MFSRWQSTENNINYLNKVTNQLQITVTRHDSTIAELLQSSQTTQSQLHSISKSINDLLVQVAKIQFVPELGSSFSSGSPLLFTPQRTTNPHNQFPFENSPTISPNSPIEPMPSSSSALPPLSPNTHPVRFEKPLLATQPPSAFQSFIHQSSAPPSYTFEKPTASPTQFPLESHPIGLEISPFESINPIRCNSRFQSSGVNHMAVIASPAPPATTITQPDMLPPLVPSQNVEEEMVLGLLFEEKLSAQIIDESLMSSTIQNHPAHSIPQPVASPTTSTPRTTSVTPTSDAHNHNLVIHQTIDESVLPSSVQNQPEDSTPRPFLPSATLVLMPTSTTQVNVAQHQVKTDDQTTNLDPTMISFLRFSPRNVHQRHGNGLCFNGDYKFGMDLNCKFQFQSTIYYPDPIPSPDPVIEFDPEPPDPLIELFKC